MADENRLILQVLPVADSDAEELADLGAELHAELLSADGASVAPLSAEATPEGAKGLGNVAGWLVAQFGTLDGLRAVLDAVRGFASRTSRTVEVSIGADVLKVTGVTSQQQEKLIDAWLARHAPAADLCGNPWKRGHFPSVDSCDFSSSSDHRTQLISILWRVLACRGLPTEGVTRVMCDLADRVSAGEPPGLLQPQPVTPLPGGRVHGPE